MAATYFEVLLNLKEPERPGQLLCRKGIGRTFSEKDKVCLQISSC